MNNFSMFLCFIVTIAAVGATISNQLCPDGVMHITCNKIINLTGNCPPGVKLVHYNQTLQQVILNAHNDKRNFIASGYDLKWKGDLAQAAADKIRQYKMGKDLCKNNDTLTNSNQKIASWGLLTSVNEINDLITAIQSFYTQVENVNQTYIHSYPENYNGPKIDRNTHVGCSGAIFPVRHKKYFKFYLMICKYASSNVPGLPEDCKKKVQNTYIYVLFRNIIQWIYITFQNNPNAD